MAMPNAVESFASNVVGDGIKPSSTITDAAKKEELQALWLAWTDDADAEGLTDFYGLQRRAAREVFLSGEVFIRIRPARGRRSDRAAAIADAACGNAAPRHESHAVRRWADPAGDRIRRHRSPRRLSLPAPPPGDLTDPGLTNETVRVPAADVIHVLDPVEAGQLRGVSRFAAAIVKLFTLDLYDDAELERKKIAAMFAMFITSPAPETRWNRPRRIWRLARPGGAAGSRRGCLDASPDSGGTYELFQYRTLLQVAAALGIPYGYLTGDTAKGNFSNTRISLIEFRRRISGLATWRAGVPAVPRGVVSLDGRGGAVRCYRPARL